MDDDLEANQYGKFQMQTVDIYEKSFFNISCIFKDSYSVSQEILVPISIHLVGSCSHKANLTVEK